MATHRLPFVKGPRSEGQRSLASSWTPADMMEIPNISCQMGFKERAMAEVVYLRR
jgi:hypothetical protein